MKNENFLNKCKLLSKGYAYLIFRVIVGILFVLHGMMKFGSGIPGNSMMLAAGIIELVVGTFVVLGLGVRLVSVIAAIEMVVAYAMAHASKSLSPLANGGEPAVLFFAAFLALATYGAGIWALENGLFKKEFF